MININLTHNMDHQSTRQLTQQSIHRQIDRQIDILMLDIPTLIFRVLCEIDDIKQVKILDEKLANINLQIDSWENSDERKSRISRIQLLQFAIDKVINCDTKLGSINQIDATKDRYEKIIHEIKSDSNTKIMLIKSELEDTKNELGVMSTRFEDTKFLSDKQQDLIQKLTNDHKIFMQYITQTQTQTQTRTRTISEDIEDKNESFLCEKEEYKNKIQNMSENISRLLSDISTKNRENSLLSDELSQEKKKNKLLNEGISNKNREIETLKEKLKNLLGFGNDILSTPLTTVTPTYTTNKK